MDPRTPRSPRARTLAPNAGDAVLALALAAAALGLLTPSRPLARHSDLLLAALVATTALGISPRELVAVRARWRTVAILTVVPFVVLAPAASGLSELFSGPTREGVASLGLAPTEVAAAGLVALAGGDAALAVATVVGSLVLSAVAGPLLAGPLGAGAGATAPLALLGRFALVVIAPLAGGLTARAAIPALGRAGPALSAASSLAVAALVYAALSGASGAGALGGAIAGSAAFLAVCAIPALAWARLAPRRIASAGGFAIGLRDFAVAAALAARASGPSAAAVAAVYGVAMLIVGALAAGIARRRRR